MDLALILPLDGPRGTRLVEALREAILSGRLSSGMRLPASRILAAQLGLSRGTVVTAYEELASEGYCESRVGAGTFVAALGLMGADTRGNRGGARGTTTRDGAPSMVAGAHRAPGGTHSHHASGRSEHGGSAQREPSFASRPRLSAWGERLGATPRLQAGEPAIRFDFRSGVSADVLPATTLARALRRSALRLGDESGTGEPAGAMRLRRALVSYLGRARGLRAAPEQVIIVSGSQQGLDLAARLLLDPGDAVCIEEPGYPRARGVFRALGARLQPLAVDRGGMITARLPAGGARMAYVTPSHQYPTGGVLAPDRRLALLGWAGAHDAWVLEDDYDSEFRYGGPPLPCLQGLDRSGRCLYLGSLSKLLHPALRIGYLIVPPALVPAAVAAKSALDSATTPVMQEALADLFESGDIERHLRRASRAYRSRRGRLLTACAAHLPASARLWPVTGGLHAYIEMPDTDPDALYHHAAGLGLALAGAADCFAAPPAGARVALWFSRIAPDLIAPGVAALAEAVRRAMMGGDHSG